MELATFNYKTLSSNFLLPTNKGVEYIDTNTIIHIKALSNYSKLFFKNGQTLVVAKVLRWFEDKLPADFIRVHRTHVINKFFLQTNTIDDSSKIILTTGEVIEVSRRKKKFVLKNIVNAA
jgi:two-component system, LytTR family, response regulator